MGSPQMPVEIVRFRVKIGPKKGKFLTIVSVKLHCCEPKNGHFWHFWKHGSELEKPQKSITIC